MEWLVIGAGCAGIAAIGKLIDHQVSPAQIGWLDPHFKVGDLGKKWSNVPSNTKVGLFLKFLHGCNSFKFETCERSFPIQSIDPNQTCFLKEVVAPLQWVTDHLLQQVQHVRGEALALTFEEGYWNVKLDNTTLIAKRVILAIGAEPKILSLPQAPPRLPLEIALNPEKLSKNIHPQDTIGVFGSSHSAILVLANLLKLDLTQVYNFYKDPHLYALYLDDWILFDDTGLKGSTAQWARENLDAPLPPKLKRMQVTHPAFQETLSLCNKVVYAVGFERRKLPTLEQFQNCGYQVTTGIIAPKLFGVGIAFPQAKFDRFGNLEYRVGLWKFLDFLNTAVPLWIQYS